MGKVTPVLEPQALEIVALIAAGIAALALILVLVLALQLRSMRKKLVLLQRGADGKSFVDVVSTKVTEVQAMRADIEVLRTDVGVLRAEVRDALRHVAVVRYDAFGDMGGRLSFSAAVLDDNGDGFVLTSIHGRTETRVYLKGVAKAAAEQVSPEEIQAIGHAAKGARTLNP